MNKFSIFMKSGGGEATLIVNKYFKQLTLIMDIMSTYEYTNEIEQFHIEIRVDGEFFTFGDIEGCNNLKFFKTKKLIANSISFGQKIYRDENTLVIFLKENIITVFQQIMKRLRKEKINIDGEKLLKDLQINVDEYLIVGNLSD